MSVGPTQTKLLKFLWESPFHSRADSAVIFRERGLIDACSVLVTGIELPNRSGQAGQAGYVYRLLVKPHRCDFQLFRVHQN